MNEHNIIAIASRKLAALHTLARNECKQGEAMRQFVDTARELLRSLQELDTESRARICLEASAEDLECLSNFTLDCAVFAIRLNSTEELGWGLLAMLFNRTEFYGTENLNDFAALHHSARKLNYDLEGYYRANRDLALPEMQQALDEYFAQGGWELSQTGYKETVTKNGEFDYTFRRSHER